MTGNFVYPKKYQGL